MLSEIGNPTSLDLLVRFGDRVRAAEKDIEYLQRGLQEAATASRDDRANLKELAGRTEKLEHRWLKLIVAGMFFLASFATHAPSSPLLKAILPFMFKAL